MSVKRILLIIARIIQATCVFGGLFIMLLENDDFKLQMVTLIGGMVLFVVGIVPAVIESAIDYRRGLDEYI